VFFLKNYAYFYPFKHVKILNIVDIYKVLGYKNYYKISIKKEPHKKACFYVD